MRLEWDEGRVGETYVLYAVAALDGSGVTLTCGLTSSAGVERGGDRKKGEGKSSEDSNTREHLECRRGWVWSGYLGSNGCLLKIETVKYSLFIQEIRQSLNGISSQATLP